MKKQPSNDGLTPSEKVTKQISELTGWRGSTMTRLRQLIKETAPEMTEGYKWNTPVWSLKGNVMSIGAFRDHVKIVFFDGINLTDPDGIINAGADAKTMRSIDLREGDTLPEAALQRLIREAVEKNGAGGR